MPKIINMPGNAVTAVMCSEVDYIMHCCNAKGVMGSGIAKEIKENRFPSFMQYKMFCDQHKDNSLGKAVITRDVINAIAQLNYGGATREVHYGALARTFVQVNNFFKGQTVKIAIPYNMASDRAGGDWEVVKELLRLFDDNITIIIYKLN